MSPIAPALSLRSLGLLVAAAVPVVLVSTLGSIATMRGLGSWYPALAKPFFTPPNVVFPVVWSFLYALMVVSSWRILRSSGESKGYALGVYAIHLGLNLAWSYVFFGLRSPWGGVAVILPLLASIFLTIRAFRPLDRAAANVLWLYFAWVCFATALNVSIAVLN